MKFSTTRPMLLVLESGKFFKGQNFGYNGKAFGEICFNTSMSGYQEIITDPSYKNQIITFTYPMIGNYGVNEKVEQSNEIQAKAIIVKEYVSFPKNFKNLGDYLNDFKIPGLQNIDTRSLVMILRKEGAQNAGLFPEVADFKKEMLDEVRELPSMVGQDLVKIVGTKKIYIFKSINTTFNSSNIENTNTPQKNSNIENINTTQKNSNIENTNTPQKNSNIENINTTQKNSNRENTNTTQKNSNIENTTTPQIINSNKFYPKLAVIDFGIKKSILELLYEEGFQITVFPPTTAFDEINSDNFDAFFLSNGPGDPSALDYAIILVKSLIKTNKPIFGICLGHQLLGLALGYESYKLKFGHRGGNQPVKQLFGNKKVEITAQNHGFAIKENSNQSLLNSHIHLNDKSISGFISKDKPLMSVQYHPEASPGPHDSRYLFKDFYKMVERIAVKIIFFLILIFSYNSTYSQDLESLLENNNENVKIKKKKKVKKKVPVKSTSPPVSSPMSSPVSSPVSNEINEINGTHDTTTNSINSISKSDSKNIKISNPSGPIINKGLWLVGKTVITAKDLENMERKLKRAEKNSKKKLGKNKKIKNKTAEEYLIEKSIVEAAAEESTIIISKEKVDNEIRRRMQYLGLSQNQFQKKIEKEYGITYEDWLIDLKFDLLKRQLIQITLQVTPPSLEEVKKFYQKNKKSIGLDISYREIVLIPKNNKFEEEKRISDIATNIYQTLLRGDKSFNEIAKTDPNNSSAYKNNGGYRPLQSIYDIAAENPVLANILFVAPLKKVLRPFRDSLNHYLIVMVEKRQTISLDKVKYLILNQMYAVKEEEAFQKWISKRKKDVIIKKLN